MHIITRSRLIELGELHADADAEHRAWERMVRPKRYANPAAVKVDFPSVDFVGKYRAIFNICRNDYRLVVDMRFDLGRVCIRHVVTHRVYERLMKRGGL